MVRNNFRTVDIIFLKDILSAGQPGREDFTQLLGDACTVEYQPRKALKLTANALEKQFTPYYTFETFQQLIERFGSDVRLDKALNRYYIEYRSRDTNDLFSYIENPDNLEIEEKKPESVRSGRKKFRSLFHSNLLKKREGSPPHSTNNH